MKFSCENETDRLALFAVAGEMTGDDGRRLRQEVTRRIEKRIRDFILDLTQLDFLDSRGLEALLWVQQQCHEELGQLRLVGVNENVLQILTMTRLAPRFTRCADLGQATSSLG